MTIFIVFVKAKIKNNQSTKYNSSKEGKIVKLTKKSALKNVLFAKE
jgi:hypothetical protein